MNSPSSAEQRSVDRKHPRRKHNPRISGEKHFNNDDAEVPFATAGFGRHRRRLISGALYRYLGRPVWSRRIAALKPAACGWSLRRAYPPYRSCGRVAEGGGLLNRYRVVKPYRGFESLRLRHPRHSCEAAAGRRQSFISYTYRDTRSYRAMRYDSDNAIRHGN
jgi:hypothetical protein